jgi:hypothetical protein
MSEPNDDQTKQDDQQNDGAGRAVKRLDREEHDRVIDSITNVIDREDDGNTPDTP